MKIKFVFRNFSCWSIELDSIKAFLTAKFLSIVVVFSVIQCGQMPREKLLNGEFEGPKSSGINALLPKNNARIINSLSTTLFWSQVSGAAAYRVEIASDAAFSEPVSGSPFMVTSQNGGPPATSFHWTPAGGYSYYWRVLASSGGKNLISNTMAIHFIKDAIYVYCAQGQTCNDSGYYGNESLPYRTVTKAVSEAIAQNVPEVRIAARGGADFYTENIIIMKAISLKGGYNAADWSRDIQNNKTILKGSGLRTISVVGVSTNTNWEISGLSLQNNNASDGTMNSALFLSSVSKRLKIHDNEIIVSLGDYANALFSEYSAAVLTNNTLSCSSSFINGCIKVQGSPSLYMSNNKIAVKNSMVANKKFRGFFMHNSSVIFMNNRIEFGSTSQDAEMIHAASDGGYRGSFLAMGNTFVPGQSRIYSGMKSDNLKMQIAMLGNTMSCSNGTNQFVSIQFDTIDGTHKSLYSHNTICGGSSPNTTVLKFYNGKPQVDNNILFATGNNYRTLIDESQNSSGLTSVTYNNFFPGQTGQPNFHFFKYHPCVGTGCSSAGCATFANMQTYLNSKGTGVGNTEFGNTANLFMNYKGADNNEHTFSDNDWSLKSTATGVLNGGASCPASMSKKVFQWGSGSDQADCDKKYPHSNSTYSAGKCESTFLYPSMQIDKTTGKVAGNGLCEDGETCLYNPNMGSYAGHGTLMNAGCNLSSVASGAFSNVELLKYQSNGY